MSSRSIGEAQRGEQGRDPRALRGGACRAPGDGSLVLDGGNAFAQQRVTQNGADAAANAGAVVLAQNLISVGVGGFATKTDQDVLTDVNAKAASNGISPAPTSYYTDITGNRLPGPIVVGSLGAGALPPATAYGVEVGGSRTFNTFMGSIFSLLPGGRASRSSRRPRRPPPSQAKSRESAQAMPHGGSCL